ncbi:phosphohydrolase [Nocardia asteroides]|uniref:phosphohydrolase n=1 Tax=Nocardia asteroides TaxID=1824 RepID=UPI001E340DC8|nr:phosphohydrolase [Nocardia asteroides]UGT52422.1 phosphohydrolase [Nocardia asteroides]
MPIATPTLDWDWATRSGGNLTAAERRALTVGLVRVVPALVPGRIRQALGRRGAGRLDLNEVRLPDTALARAAEIEAREHLSDTLLAHSFRTYFFARALAELDGVDYDDEIAYVASLLHDLKLERPTPGRCFAVVGGESAHGFAVRHGAPRERAAAIGAAIAAHLNPDAAENLGDPGGFVSAGASVDVLGRRLADLAPDWVDDLLVRHPRQDFKRQLVARFTAEAAAVPEGRIHWLNSTGFLQLIKLAPFAE